MIMRYLKYKLQTEYEKLINPKIDWQGATVYTLHKILQKKTNSKLHSEVLIDELEAFVSKKINSIKSPEKVENLYNSSDILLTIDDGYRTSVYNLLSLARKYNFKFLAFINTSGCEGNKYLWPDILDRVIIENNISLLRELNSITSLHTLNSHLSKNYSLANLVRRNLLLSNDPEINYKLNEFVINKSLEMNLDTELLSEIDIRNLSNFNNICFGAHTHNHINLATNNSQIITEDIAKNLGYIEKYSSLKPASFAYPYGGYEFIKKKNMEILKDLGLDIAYTTELKPYRNNLMYTLPRVSLNFHENSAS